MIKNIYDFVKTSITILLGYVMYFIIAAVCTFILGLPIGLGVYTVMRAIQLFFNGV